MAISAEEKLVNAKHPEVGIRLRQLLGKDSLNSVATKLDIAESTLRAYFDGVNLPKGPSLVKLADFFAVSTDWILKGDEAGIDFVDPFDVPAFEGDSRDKKTLREMILWRAKVFGEAYRVLFEATQDLPKDFRPSTAELISAAKAAVSMPFN